MTQYDSTYWYNEALMLLSDLISTPSYSKEEQNTAAVIAQFFDKHRAHYFQFKNNIIALANDHDLSKPTILLNSHHDTVRPNANYTLDPFKPIIDDEKIFGLGSNDAGGSLVSLICTYLYFYQKKQSFKYNLILAATAEEEISGFNGIEAVLNLEKKDFPFGLHPQDLAIVGEPTMMQMAIAEKGLMVVDAKSHGKAGHAAREEGESALLKALHDIHTISNHKFGNTSPLLGANKVSATVISTENKAHNVVPVTCDYVLDCRVNELTSFDDILASLKSLVSHDTTLKPRSTRLRSTAISTDHILIKSGLALGLEYYGSPTTSDKALIPHPSLKFGPGFSGRSHSADEYIFLQEISDGIAGYIALLSQIL